MYKNILVPIALDQERDTDSALTIAHSLLADGGTITVLTVVEEVPAYVDQYLPANHFETQLEEAQSDLQAKLKDVTGVKPVILVGHSGRTIVDYADEKAIDCIIIASHRPELKDYFLGSTATRVVRHAKCAVHITR
ncbi:MAG: universal stress protein [Pseudomonadota bacterium]